MDDLPEDRLEAALERIAKHVEAPAPVVPPVDPAVAARLDGLIAELRGALDT